MQIELRKLSEIKPYPGNSRQNDAAVNAVAKSIRELGFRQPTVVYGWAATLNVASGSRPRIAVANRALKPMKEFLTEFGMTPSSRVRLGVTSTEPLNELDRFLLDQG